jgi:trimeric autotransporter adhesin
MTTKTWTGNAAPVAQVTTLTPASPNANDTFTVTVNNKSVSYQTAAGTIADVCNGLATALANAPYSEFGEFTPQNAISAITLTGNTAGVPFTVSLSVQTSGGATFTQAATTACTGPNFWDNAANWSSDTIPANGDDVVFNSGNVACLYNISQPSITLNSLSVYQTYTGTIGLPLYNTKGYYEYRPTELAVSATSLNVGQFAGTSAQGSGRIKINVGTNICTLNVYNTGQPLDQGNPAFTWRGTNAGNVVNVNKGQVGIAFFPGNAATVDDLNVGYVSNVNGDVQLTAGALASVGTVTQNGGNVTFYGGMTSLLVTAGTCTVYGTGGAGSLAVNQSGSVTWNSTGTISGNPVVADKGVLDFSKDQQPKTVTNPIQKYGDSSQIIDPDQVVGSLVIVLEQSDDLSGLELGENLTLTRTAV